MSFRTRLSLFFVLIVIVPMASLTVVLFRLIADNENGKADAGVAARQSVAIRLVEEVSAEASEATEAIGGDARLATALQRGDGAGAQVRAGVLLEEFGAKRIVIGEPERLPIVDVGSRTAVFPAKRRLQSATGRSFGTLQVSVTGPKAFVARVRRVSGVDAVVRRKDRTLASSLAGTVPALGPGQRRISVAGRPLRATTFAAPSFTGQPVSVSVLDAVSATSSDIRDSRLLAGGILLGFFLLAFTFAVLVSRSLQRQIAGFLDAARRLGQGDFTAKVPTVGRDEFAELGVEFNEMSAELERRLAELRAEQVRLNSAMRRIGETFAANLDRGALLEIVLRTALDGAAATAGRASARPRPDAALEEVAAAGTMTGLERALWSAESRALAAGAPRDVEIDGVTALAHPLRSVAPIDGVPARAVGGSGGGVVTGIVSVARAGTPFTESERELFHYLTGQAAVSLENVGLHETVERQAVTDELTGLSNRRRFDEALSTELERSRRFGQPVGLVLLDIDDFKRVNDTHGHQCGDEVLREVARVVRASSREIDEPARYGGEEMAMVLPGTDLDGAFNLAERVRTQLSALALQAPDGSTLVITASFGVATHPDSAGDLRGLVEAADAALYEAKRTGKNRTVRATEVPSA